MVKIRTFTENNYKSIYSNGKTFRFFIDENKPITELDYPEFYDIKLTNRCNGRCNYCYQNSIEDDKDYESVNKLNKFFGSLSENEKPFQIAYGGGEPTLHYQFHDIMKLTRDHGISPNYTTNGMFVESDDCKKIIETTKKYCEGIAITCHRHLERYWKKAIDMFLKEKIFSNFHILISDKESVDYFMNIYEDYSGKVKYFVMLPMIEHGRAKDIKQDFDYFFNKLNEIKLQKGNINDVAFGANFYPYLINTKYKFDISLYEPEILSKYLDLKDMSVYKSSFNTDKVIKKINI